MAQAKKVNRKPVHRRALRGVHLALVPHRHNDYHPHLIRHYGLAVILLLVVALQAFHFTFENNQILGDQSDITTTQLLNQTNSQRADNALAALRLNDKLSLAAQEKAQDMLDRGYWSHDAPDGTPPWRWITDNDYKYVDAGENLARGFNTTDGITRAWMESPTHRANILDANYT
ncbi:MAG: CAP domain-containing protein, partial [Candidatus Nomurabacteria bacterium]|nr:CAP domain-containing protein [Candidatus Nomurabacteria bacterium]